MVVDVAFALKITIGFVFDLTLKVTYYQVSLFWLFNLKEDCIPWWLRG